MAGAVYFGMNSRAVGDGIFTFTLANTPYEFNYIDSKIDRFPNENGWMDAGILKEQYEVMPYDRFNYSSVYWHQRLDNHPLLYYSAIHTVCSLFPETYSVWYAYIINLIALLFIDFILVRIARFVFPEQFCAPVILLVAATSMSSFYQMVVLARMYMLLALMSVWFLWICLRLVYRQAVSLVEIFFCVLLGSQTHYYFYVFVALCGFITLLMLCKDRAWKQIRHILLTFGIAIFTSLILFPWVVWHIIFNQMDKNETLRLWDLETLVSWIKFVNSSVFNNRGIVWVILAVVLIVHAIRVRQSGVTMRLWILLGGSAVAYSMVIYTLNGASGYYATPVYMPMAIIMTAMVLQLWEIYGKNRIGSGNAMETILCLVMILVFLGGISADLAFAGYVSGAHQEYLPFHQVALDHKGADCLYVAAEDNNLLDNLWFEFGEYDEFRKISIDEYETLHESDGESAVQTILQGRETQNPVVIYLPITAQLPEGIQAIATMGDFQVAVLYE